MTGDSRPGRHHRGHGPARVIAFLVALFAVLAAGCASSEAPASDGGGTHDAGSDAADDCGQGAVCNDDNGVPGCTAEHGCPADRACCGGVCVKLESDPDHCGACNNACSREHVSNAVCSGGVCTGQCAKGFGDCNGDRLSDGCETNIDDSVEHCGSCGQACSDNHLTLACTGGACSGPCDATWADCNGDKRTDGCETNTESSVFHCGGCGLACSQNYITPACTAGVCEGECGPGSADCNGDKRTDGCETDIGSTAASCGACGAACSQNHISPACIVGICDGKCELGFADCNNDKRTDGCETELLSNVASCGGCGAVCSQNHITPACTAGNCTGECAPGFADCNGDKRTDGCETEILSNAASCGACGVKCSANHITPTCTAGVCDGECAPGFADCNGDKRTDGCETNIASSASSCGACGVVCSLPHAASTCVAGSCQIASCGAGHRDCDGLASTGCEVAVNTDTENCGACGIQCEGELICRAGSCTAAPCTGTIGLPGTRNLTTGTAPVALAAGDLNGDGLEDLAVANAGDDTVSVLINQGMGDFASHVAYATGENPRAVTIADVDGDGRRDLVVANWSANTVTVLLNQGNGVFAARVDYPAGGSPESIVAADLDGDGDLDLATTGYYANGVNVLLNAGNGSFGANVTYPIAWSTTTVAAADLDGNGSPDLAVLSTYGTNAVSVFSNQGDGTFGPRVDHQSGAIPTTSIGRPGLALGDVNGDGRADIVTNGNGVSILLSEGNGSFSPRVAYATAGFSWEGRSVVLADFNGDGAKDIAVAVDADIYNGPGDLDGNVTVLMNRGDGSFTTRQDYLTGLHPVGIVAADLDGSGLPDIATTDLVNHAEAARGNRIDVLLNLGDGAFPSRQDYPATLGPYSVAIRDLNGDSKADIVIANIGIHPYQGKSVTVYLNAGAGTFDYPTCSSPISVAIEDVDQDGHPDLAVSCTDTLSILLNDGTGTFASRVDYPSTRFPQALVAADLSGDGKPDVAVVDRIGNTVGIHLNLGNGTFGPIVKYPTGAAPHAVVAADINGDGMLDLAVANHDANTASVLLNQGLGKFAPKVDYATGRKPRSIAVADLNGDGKVDLATANNADRTMSVLLRQAGGFASKVDYPAGSDPVAIVATDLDSDGDPDLVVTNYWSVSVLVNRGAGIFGARAEFDTGAAPIAVAAGDLDGDGRNDVVTANNLSNDISVLLNRCWR